MHQIVQNIKLFWSLYYFEKSLKKQCTAHFLFPIVICFCLLVFKPTYAIRLQILLSIISQTSLIAFSQGSYQIVQNLKLFLLIWDLNILIFFKSCHSQTIHETLLHKTKSMQIYSHHYRTPHNIFIFHVHLLLLILRSLACWIHEWRLECGWGLHGVAWCCYCVIDRCHRFLSVTNCSEVLFIPFTRCRLQSTHT